MTEYDTEKCHCEDPFNVGEKLRLCGQAICLRLNSIEVPKPTIVLASLKVIDDEDSE